MRALWALQDKLALTSEEEKTIELKREVVSGQVRATWNPMLALPPIDFEFSDVEGAHIRAALKAWNSYGANVDRQWLQPLLQAVCPGGLR